MHRVAEQRDAADEGRLEACESTMVGLVIVNHGRVVLPSQVIVSVRPTEMRPGPLSLVFVGFIAGGLLHDYIDAAPLRPGLKTVVRNTLRLVGIPGARRRERTESRPR